MFWGNYIYTEIGNFVKNLCVCMCCKQGIITDPFARNGKYFHSFSVDIWSSLFKPFKVANIAVDAAALWPAVCVCDTMNKAVIHGTMSLSFTS